MKNRVAVASLVVGLIGGGVAGTALGITALAGADSTTSSTVSPNTPSNGSAPHSNEDATHEKAETPQREADENAGRVGWHHGSNENAAHESQESPQRESQESAGNATTPSSPAAPTPAQ